MDESPIHGVDISKYQDGIGGLPGDFRIVKSTQGVDWFNTDFERQCQTALGDGQELGVYHWVDAGANKPAEEVAWWMSKTKKYIGKALFLLDFEGSALRSGPDYAYDVLRLASAEVGHKVPIYLQYSECIKPGYDKIVAERYPLWRAGQDNIGGGFRVPERLDDGRWPADLHIMDQYTSQGQLPGWAGRLDLDIFYGSRKDWRARAGIITTIGDDGSVAARLAELTDAVNAMRVAISGLGKAPTRFIITGQAKS